MTRLSKGDKAPPFSLKDQDDNTLTLKDFSGSRLLVYFYPKANTPGCTRQSCSVSEALPDLRKLSVKAVGISPDLPAAQKKIRRKIQSRLSAAQRP